MKNNYENRVRWEEDPKTYQHFIKKGCVVCEVAILATDYVVNGNFCQRCCVKATKMAHQRLWEKKEMAELRGEIPVDNPFARKLAVC